MASQNLQMYGSGFDGNVYKDVKALTEKIEKEQDPEEILKLRMQRLYRGMELNAGPLKRNYGSMFPY